MQQMKEDMLKERGGDPKKYGPGYQNPYQYQPKKAKRQTNSVNEA